MVGLIGAGLFRSDHVLIVLIAQSMIVNWPKLEVRLGLDQFTQYIHLKFQQCSVLIYALMVALGLTPASWLCSLRSQLGRPTSHLPVLLATAHR